MDKEIPENGVIYIATGKELFLKEAKISAKSVRKYNKDIGISIFVDEKNKFEDNENLFDSIHFVENPEFGFGDKIYAMINTPYHKTIYLDCDTIVAGDITEIFNMLDEYDVAASNPPFKNTNYKPDSFQAGIVFYKMSEVVKKFLNSWNDNYDRINDGNDQPSFRRMILQLPISLFIFPPNYNFRSPFASYVNGVVKIFHDHNLCRVNNTLREAFINFINESSKERYWFPNKGVLEFPRKIGRINKQISILDRIITKSKFSPFKKLINYYIIKSFPWLINWIIPKQYRKRMTTSYKKLLQYSK